MKKIALRIFLAGLLSVVSSELHAATYYFSVSGNNTSGNGSQASPFYSLCGPYNGAPCATGTSKISMGQITINPGDTLLFKRGDEWRALDAQWSINTAGTTTAPITFGAYGDSAAPRPKFTGAKTAFELSLDSQWTNVSGTPIWWVPLVYDPQTVAQEESAPEGQQLYGSASVSGVTNANGWMADQSMVRGTFAYDWSAKRMYVWRTDNLKPDHSQGRDIFIGQGIWDGSNRLVKVMRPAGVAGGHYVFQDLHVRMSPAYGFSTSYPGTKYINCLSELNGMEGFLFDRRRFGAPLPGAKDGEVRNSVARWNNLQPYHGIGQAITIETENVWIYDSEVYENAWAGIDFLDYHTNTKAESGGVVNSKVHNNGIHPTMRDNYDPNIYVDGGSHITIKNCQLWGAGVDPRGVRTRNYANPGVSFDLEGAAFSVGRRPTNLQLINSVVYGNLGPAVRIGGINGSQSAVDSLSNVKIIGNTLMRDRGDSDIKSWNDATQADAGQRVVNYNGVNGLLFKNNLVLALNSARAPIFGSGKTLTTGKSVADFDNNFYFCPGCSFDTNGSFGAGGFFSYNYITNATLDQWRNVGATNAALRQDVAFAKSVMISNPGLANTTAAIFYAHLSSTSPALNRADASVFPAGLAGSTQTDGTYDSPYNDLGFHYVSPNAVTPLPSPDTTAPTAPTGLAVTSTGSQINVEWSSATDNVAVASYRVYQDGVAVANVTTLFYSTTGTQGSAYAFEVRAIDAAGNVSSTSGALSVTVPITMTDTTAPTTPTLTGVLSGAQANLSWTAAMDDVAVTGYRISQNGNTVATVTSTSWSTTSFTASTIHSFTVVALDAAGNASVASNTVVLTPTAPTSNAPTNFSATYGNGKTRLTWSPVANTSTYTVYRNGSWWNMYTTTDVYDTTVSGGTTYAYKVSANLSSGTSTDFTPEVSVTTPTAADITAPSVPGGLSVSLIDGTDVFLTWAASADNVAVTGYRVFNNTTALGDASVASFSFTSGAQGVTYHLSVVAMDAAGNLSAKSTPISIIVPDILSPTVPAGLQAARVGADVMLSWMPSTDDSFLAGYNVFDGATLLGTTPTASFKVANAPDGRTYTFSVVAFDQQTNRSAASAVLTYTVPMSVGTPENLIAFKQGSGVHLSWSAAAGTVAASFEVLRNQLTVATATGSFWDDAAVQPGTTYSYQVRQFNAAGVASTWTTPVAVALPALDTVKPSIPANLVVVRTNDTAALAWTTSTDNVGVTGYRVYSNNALLATVSTNSFAATGLQPSRTYGFAIVAVDAAGNASVSSATAYLTTPSDIQAPTASVLAVVKTGSGRKLDWTASTDNVGVQAYNIYRNGKYLTTMTTRSYIDKTTVTGSVSYKIQAYDLASNTSISNEVTI